MIFLVIILIGFLLFRKLFRKIFKRGEKGAKGSIDLKGMPLLGNSFKEKVTLDSFFPNRN
jgi:hypothetical protein